MVRAQHGKWHAPSTIGVIEYAILVLVTESDLIATATRNSSAPQEPQRHPPVASRLSLQALVVLA